MLQKLFGFDPAKHNVKTEMMAGLTSFLTMAYILAVNPNIFSALADQGMDTQAVFTATVIASVIGTLVMAFYAKMPFGLAPGMGLNAFFVYTVCLTMGYTWQFALTAILIEGIIFIILSLTKVREMIVNAIPVQMKTAISVGIGLFIASLGLKNAGLVVIVSNMWGKGIIKIVPILLGVLASYILAACMGKIDFTAFNEAAWIGFPVARENTVLAVFDNVDTTLLVSSIVAIMPIAFATIMEHIGDMCAISSTVGKDYLEDPGLHRTLTGDGIATALASLFGAPANTTYGENTGVLNLTKVFDPRVIRLAAVLAILLSFCPKFASLIGLMPAATIGGVSLILYGMISAVGVRNMIDARVNFASMRNVIIAALILVIAIGVKYGANDSIPIGPIHISGLALAAIVGIVLNAVLPKDIEVDLSKYSN